MCISYTLRFFIDEKCKMSILDGKEPGFLIKKSQENEFLGKLKEIQQKTLDQSVLDRRKKEEIMRLFPTRNVTK